MTCDQAEENREHNAVHEVHRLADEERPNWIVDKHLVLTEYTGLSENAAVVAVIRNFR